MPLAGFVPSEFEYDYPRWTAPAIGSTDTGKAWAWNNVTGKYEPVTFLLASAVSAYGLTLASAADAAAARTTLGLGTAAVLNVGTGANQIVKLDGLSRLPAVDGSQLTGITVAAAGSNTQVIYNASGVYAGDAGLTYNASTDRLTVAGGLVAGDWSPPSDSTTAVSIWNAARSARVVSVDTTNARIGIGTVPLEKIHVFGGSSVAYAIFTNDATTNNANRGTFFGIDIGANSYNWNWENKTMFFGTSGATRMRVTGAGLIAAGSQLPTALLDIDSSTSSRASLRIRAGTAPTTPNAGDIWDDGALVAYNIDATTNAVVNSLKLRRGSSGTPAAGFGLGISARLESSTTEDQDAGRLTFAWVTATHATRASRGKLTAYYTTTEQEAMTWDGDTGGLKLGFYGGTPVAKAAAYTQTYSTADRTLAAYTSDTESVAYTGIDNAQAGTVYATVADLDALRTAYENLRAFVEDLAQHHNAVVDDLQALNLVG